MFNKKIIVTALALLSAAITTQVATGEPVLAELNKPVKSGSCVSSDTKTPSIVEYKWASKKNIWRARPILESLVLTSRPGGGKTQGTVSSVTIETHQVAWYLVLDARQVKDKCYILLRLPAVKSANSRMGWVDKDNLLLQRSLFQIEVNVKTRKITVYRGIKPVLRSRVVVGKKQTPTPLSPLNYPFAMYDSKIGSANAFTGSWELATTAQSPTDYRLGRIGLHGRGGKSLNDPLGSASSNGCIRMPNQIVSKIVTLIGLDNLGGVPVLILP